MGTNCDICTNKCYGIEGYHGSCCSIEDRDYIIGPHYDTEEFVKNLSLKFGREVNFYEINKNFGVKILLNTNKYRIENIIN